MPIKIFSMNWWISTLVTAFVLMMFIYMIKVANKKVKLPVVGDIIESV